MTGGHADKKQGPGSTTAHTRDVNIRGHVRQGMLNNDRQHLRRWPLAWQPEGGVQGSGTGTDGPSEEPPHVEAGECIQTREMRRQLRDKTP